MCCLLSILRRNRKKSVFHSTSELLKYNSGNDPRAFKLHSGNRHSTQISLIMPVQVDMLVWDV